MLSKLRSEVHVDADEVAEIRRRLVALEQRLEALERAPSPGGTCAELRRRDQSVGISPISSTPVVP